MKSNTARRSPCQHGFSLINSPGSAGVPPAFPGSPRQHGFSLITSLFVLIAFASIAAAMVSIMGTQTQSVNLALLEAQVYSAASAGIEYGSYRAVNTCYCGRSGATSTENFNPAVYTNLGIGVTVTCTSNTYNETTSYHVYSVTAVATYGTFGAPDYVSRQITVSGSDALASPACP